ncbi:uncharacterized protein LOC135467105 [Liolophura sinensis]|uniref:uncharacterized protein LOC135467105 n=1 Tax=Liolophura sinensis TaxID=3198878 RepID=UPI003158DE87
MGVMRDFGRLRGCLIVILIVPLVHSHVRFVCPRPRSPRTDLTEDQQNGACGLGNPEDSQRDEDVTVVSPGPLTVRFEETHFHTDSPFHISLHSYDNDTHWCSLLNHIPHNNMASVDNPGCKDSVYPIGHCTKSTYYVTVNIPDVSCELCYLKLSFITLDKVPMSKLPCQEPNGTCKTYVSCANIKIQGHSSGGSDDSHGLETCTNYSDNLLGKWPYTQQQVFKATLSPEVEATFTFDYYDMSLSYHIPTKTIGTVMSVELYKNGENKTTLLRQSITVDDNTDDGVTGKWKNPSIPLPQLIVGNYQVKIVTIKKTFQSSLKYLRDMHQPGVYVPQRASYSKQGWLNGPEFVGPGASYSEGVEPFGKCAPQPYYYISSMVPQLSNLHLNLSQHPPHGVLSAAFTDNRVHITAIFHGLSEHAQLVTLQGPVLAETDIQIDTVKVCPLKPQS